MAKKKKVEPVLLNHGLPLEVYVKREDGHGVDDDYLLCFEKVEELEPDAIIGIYELRDTARVSRVTLLEDVDG